MRGSAVIMEKLTEEVTPKKTRPVWFKDLKWVFSIIFVLIFGSTLLAWNFVWLTEEGRAIEINAALMAASLSRGGLDDTSDIEEVRQMLVKTGEDIFQPIPGLNVFVTRQEIEATLKTASPRQARIDFFKKFSRPLYEKGPEGLGELTDDPELKKQIVEGIGPLAILTRQNHLFVQKIFYILAAISALALIFIVLFARRFGRLSAPGLAILISTLPWFALTTLLSFGFAEKVAEGKPLGEETETMSVAMNVAANALAEPMKTISGRYLAVMLAALGLIGAAILGKIILAVVKKFRRA